MTRSLQQMMEVTDNIITSLQQEYNSPPTIQVPIPQIIHTHTSNLTASAHTEEDDVLTQPLDISTQVPEDQMSTTGLDNDSHDISVMSVTAITSTPSNNTASKTIIDIGPDPFIQLLDDIRYKREGDYRIILQKYKWY